MSRSVKVADPLDRQPPADRPAYATGMLLDAQDFLDEQTYHRGRLARALMQLAGGGTLAGLRVWYQAAIEGGEETRPEEEIRVEAGLAVDRLGRLIELQRPACLRLQRWWNAEMAIKGGSLVNGSCAYDNNLARLLSARASNDLTLPDRAVIADVFLGFNACPRGLTPAFAQGPYDALNAVATSRVRDAYELRMCVRPGLGVNSPSDDSSSDYITGLPLPAGSVATPGEDPDKAKDREAAMGDPTADSAAHRAALQDAVLYGYATQAAGGGNDDGSAALAAGPEHPTGADTSSIFLARVLIPVGTGNPPERAGDNVLVDNFSRRFLPGVAMLARWNGY